MKCPNTVRFRSAVMVIAVACSVLVPSYAHAGAWGESFEAAILKQMLEKIQRQIDGVLLGTLKSTAISLLNTRVANLIGGSSTSASLVITDWRAYLYQEPQTKVKLAMDTIFYPSTLRNRTSNFSSGSGGAVYENYLHNRTEKLLSDADLPAGSVMTISEISPDPISAIGKGDISVFNKLIESGSDPYGYALKAEGYKMKKTEEAQKEQEIKAIASGYKGVEDKHGNTILPGSTVGQMVADVQDIGNKVIAASQNPAELVSGVVTSLANRMITNLIQNGLGKIQSTIQREIASVDSQIMNQVNVVNRTLGQGAMYTSSIRQQVNVNLKAADSGAAMPILSGH